MIHNNHCYKLTCNEKSFEQLIKDIKKNQNEFEPSYKFPTYKEDTKAYRTVFIKQLDDVVPHIISNVDEHNIRFLYDYSLDEMTLEMISNKYIPEVIFKDGSIKGINFKVKDVKYTIQCSDMTSDRLQEIDEEDYEEYNKNNNMVTQWLLNETFVSRFNEQTRKILDEYTTTPLTCQLNCLSCFRIFIKLDTSFIFLL